VLSDLLVCFFERATMTLDCIRASDVGLGKGWVVINTINGGIVAHHKSDDSEFAWMKAAEVLAEGIADMQRTIQAILQNCHRRLLGLVGTLPSASVRAG